MSRDRKGAAGRANSSREHRSLTVAAQCRSSTGPLPPFDRQVRPLGRTGVVAGRSDDLVVLPLFQNVGAPAGNAAGSEDAREQLSRNAHVMLQAGRIEIDV